MRKNKILFPIMGILSIGSVITPCITLTSCGNENEPEEKLVPVPEEKLDIYNDAQFGLTFNGISPDTDLSLYNAIVLPDDINCTKGKSFELLTKENHSNIKTIVFSKNLTKIIKNTLLGCETVTKLDFSKCEYINNDNFQWSNSSFSGIIPNHEGQFVFNPEKVSQQEMLIILLQHGLSGDWLKSDIWTSMEWTHYQDKPWRYCFKPLEFENPQDPVTAIKNYASAINAVPSIFIDDFLYAYGNIIPQASGVGSLNQLVSGVSISIDGNDVRGSFNLSFVTKSIDGDQIFKIQVEYKKIPLKMNVPEIWTEMSDTYKAAVSFDKSKIDESSWADGASIQISGFIGNNQYDKMINTKELFAEFKKETTPSGLFAALYDNVEIPSSYYRNLVIENE